MTKYEHLTNQIEKNFEELSKLPSNSIRASELRHDQTVLLQERMHLTIEEAQEVVK